jgi:hypothetical protein
MIFNCGRERRRVRNRSIMRSYYEPQKHKRWYGTPEDPAYIKRYAEVDARMLLLCSSISNDSLDTISSIGSF